MSKEKPVTLEETRIWEKYDEMTKDSAYLDRKTRVCKIYNKSRELLTAVSKTFSNYTLHNETHIVNVLNAMSGILGDKIDNLSIQEFEVLIIVASLHDVGMTYTDDQEKEVFSNSIQIERFLKERYPGEYELNPDNWEENMKQDYLRYLHPFRVKEIISGEDWRDIFNSWPSDMVGVDTLVEICQAHGMTFEEIEENNLLKYSITKKTDALFCAMLLRLADLLDFDDSRAPSVLFKFAKNNKKSCEEFEKHMASGGFTYPVEPSEDDLPYSATCPSPNVEHAINVFLNWVDEELQNCRFLQEKFRPQWKKDLAFPRKVSREEIDTEDFLGGEYSLELNFDQIMNLLSGEELYSAKDVFVRELLQNSIDATLLRAKMDSSFCVEEAPIEMWEWTDSDGWWFRIDDCGTGMTLGMIKKYFLSVGSSYYSSQELKRDLSQHDFQNKSKYTGISKFGIGFLSCFLCGSYAEISTLHFDENKCKKDYKNVNKTTKYGIRLEMGRNERFYTIRCQANNNICPTPLPCDKEDKYGSDYRNICGTSVVIKLDASKLESIDIKQRVEKIIYGTRMPVYFNGERIGKTRYEIIDGRSKYSNCKVTVELSESEKEEFGQVFPELKGMYPSFEKKYLYFDSTEEINVDGFTGYVETVSVNFSNIKDIIIRGVPFKLVVSNRNDGCLFKWYPSDLDKYIRIGFSRRYRNWGTFLASNTNIEKEKLEAFFNSCPTCPDYTKLGSFTDLFTNGSDLEYVWRLYLEDALYDYRWYYNYDHAMYDSMTVSYKGIIQDYLPIDASFISTRGFLLLDDEWCPSTNVARTDIISFPLEVRLLVDYLSLEVEDNSYDFIIDGFNNEFTPIDMNTWRDLMNSKLGIWMINRLENHLHPNSELYRSIQSNPESIRKHSVICSFIEAYCLDYYSMKVSFLDDKITADANVASNTDIGILPPMLLCSAYDEYSRQFVCGYLNKGPAINKDHFFVKWFIENAALLRKNFNSTYLKIIYAMKTHKCPTILNETKNLVLQIDKYGNLCNISSDIPKRLTEDSFINYFDNMMN
ncbi:MAG: hypothetical protein SPL61_12380 [Saccharofermentans sp.]|nr:hypothetical protein [Saccharofermentans sp.]